MTYETPLGSFTQGLVTAAELRAAGRDPRGPGPLVRVRRGVYAAAALPSLPRHVVTGDGVSANYVVHVRAALLSLGPRAVARGRTAAALRGWGLLVEPGRLIEVAVPHGLWRADPPGVVVQQRRNLVTESVQAVPGSFPVPVISAVHTIVECCTTRPLIEAVAMIDSALRARDVSLPELHRAAAALPGVSDAARVRRALALCDAECGSVLESVQRVRMLLAAVTGFRTQAVLRTPAEGGQIRVDFCFDEARLVVEVDGQRWHPDPHVDRARDNALVALGWRVLRYTWAEVVHDSARVITEIRRALTSAHSLHPGSTEGVADAAAA